MTLCFHSLQLLSLPLVVAKKVSVLARVHVLVNLQQEPLAEFKCLKGELVLWSCAINVWIEERMKGETEPRTWGNCSVSCHTHSRNWVKIGDTSFGSPSNWSHLQVVNRLLVDGTKRTWPICPLCPHSSSLNSPLSSIQSLTCLQICDQKRSSLSQSVPKSS